jgi:hypothetical protein
MADPDTPPPAEPPKIECKVVLLGDSGVGMSFGALAFGGFVEKNCRPVCFFALCFSLHVGMHRGAQHAILFFFLSGIEFLGEN